MVRTDRPLHRFVAVAEGVSRFLPLFLGTRGYREVLNYPHDRNTWEPWKNMRDAEKVHEFLIAKNLKHLIPSIQLYTDASDFGIGGVLFQVVDTIWQPIAFISKSLTPTQIMS